MNRYIRQEVLGQIGREGQKKISESKIAIIGVGALGTVTSELLVRAGVKDILLVDDDEVDIINLQRQLLFFEEDKGKKKTLAAKEKLEKINSKAKIKTKEAFLTRENSSMLKGYDLILDCTDNMRSRHIINDSCEEKNKTWIYAAGSGVQGNICVVKDYKRFREVFKSNESFDSCEEIGVINTLTTVVASLQVTEAIKIITGKPHCEDLIRFNLWENKYEKIKWRG